MTDKSRGMVLYVSKSNEEFSKLLFNIISALEIPFTVVESTNSQVRIDYADLTFVGGGAIQVLDAMTRLKQELTKRLDLSKETPEERRQRELNVQESLGRARLRFDELLGTVY